jgi:hypothetical protein
VVAAAFLPLPRIRIIPPLLLMLLEPNDEDIDILLVN